jgi:hypothetical protein
MTTGEIQTYVNDLIEAHFEGVTTESGEMMTSARGDGRFFGKVIATRYGGLPDQRDLFLAIGTTEHQAQIVKLGKSECLTPEKDDLDVLLYKELGVKA